MNDIQPDDRFTVLRTQLANVTGPAVHRGDTRGVVAGITASALIDIAESLATMALESALAMRSSGVLDSFDDAIDGSDDGPSDGPDDTPIEVGDYVKLAGGDDDDVLEVTAIGQAEGRDWLSGTWLSTGARQSASKAWADQFRRVEPLASPPVGDESDMHDSLDDDFAETKSVAAEADAFTALKSKGKNKGKGGAL